MSFRKLSLATVSLACVAMAPVASAHADGRYGSYYADDGWDGGYYPPDRLYRPGPSYREYYQPGDDYDGRPWRGRQAYAPYDSYYDGDEGPAMRPRPVRPPRPVLANPDQPRRLSPARPKAVTELPAAKVAPAKPKATAAAPVTPLAPVQEARVLPVPRPNLESMDFDPVTPAPQK